MLYIFLEKQEQILTLIVEFISYLINVKVHIDFFKGNYPCRSQKDCCLDFASFKILITNLICQSI